MMASTPRSSRWRRWLRPRRLIWIALAAAAVIATTLALRETEADEPPETADVVAADIRQLVQAAGVLTPSTQVDVGAQVSGQVRTIHVELGQTVRAGELLVSIDPDTARSDVEVAEAAVAEQRSAMEATDALRDRAEANARRNRELIKSRLVSQAALDETEAELRRLKADYKRQFAALDRFTAELANRRLALSRTAITAPMHGVVVNIAVSQGQTVNASQTTPVLLTLADIDRMTVRTKVAEADVLKVKVGQPASFTTLSGLSQPLRGRVRVIQPVPEKSGNASFYNVLFEVENPGRVLLPQMTVRVHIESGSIDSAPMIPSIALGERRDDGRYEVFTWTAEGGIKRRWVRIGLQDATRTQILDGLRVGEQVMLSPADGSNATNDAATTPNNEAVPEAK
jgi:membrane fusion protein, macrolide-specific efflux system